MEYPYKFPLRALYVGTYFSRHTIVSTDQIGQLKRVKLSQCSSWLLVQKSLGNLLHMSKYTFGNKPDFVLSQENHSPCTLL